LHRPAERPGVAGAAPSSPWACRRRFKCALFSSPEGRSMNCFVLIPFKTGMHEILPKLRGKGRFPGSNIGVVVNGMCYGKVWQCVQVPQNKIRKEWRE